MVADRVTTFKIYVGNIHPDAKNEDIQKIFEEFGTVVECDTLGKRAFVHMEDDIEGKHAIGELQGREINGIKLIIAESRKNDLPRIPSVKLLVKNISSSVDARGLRNMFKRFGCVLEVEIEDGEGFVCLEAIGDIRSAINDMNGFKIDDMELSVEPAPIPVSTDYASSSSYSSSPKKDRNSFSSNTEYDKYGSSWAPVEPESEDNYYDSGGYGYDNSYDNPSPWMFPTRNPFQNEPEKILRDPYARGRGRARARGGFGGGGQMGERRPPPRMMPPLPPSHFQDPSMGGRVMRSGMPARGHPNPFLNQCGRGGPPPPQHNPWQQSYEESAFYEDEPVAVVPRAMPPGRMKFTGANSMPIGRGGGGGGMGMGLVFRDPGFQGRNGNANRRGGRGRGGGGGGRPNKFTALTDEIGPGERYPVPPEFNPGFRAPMKRPKEEVKKKTKKKKKPLVPAELPDYSVPVPDLPRETVPKGAILTPFPTPQSISVITSDTFAGNGSTNFFGQQDQSYQSSSSQMDFTTDECT